MYLIFVIYFSSFRQEEDFAARKIQGAKKIRDAKKEVNQRRKEKKQHDREEAEVGQLVVQRKCRGRSVGTTEKMQRSVSQYDRE